jgi:hypothetical protein
VPKASGSRKGGFRPGQKAPASGQYPIVGPRGGKTGTERTVVKNEPFPPTPESGQTYGTPDKTKTS